MNIALKTKGEFSYRQYKTWPDEERWELINGVAYNMTPAPNRKHQEIAGSIFNQFYNFLKGKKCKAYMAPFDVRLPLYNENEDDIINIVQPDVLVVCDKNKLDSKGAIGAPDLVVEILSPSTAAKDLREKMALYEQAGVLEYWLVDPHDNIVMIHKLVQNSYGRAEIFAGSEKIPVGIFNNELIIELQEVFNED